MTQIRQNLNRNYYYFLWFKLHYKTIHKIVQIFVNLSIIDNSLKKF